MADSEKESLSGVVSLILPENILNQFDIVKLVNIALAVIKNQRPIWQSNIYIG